MIRLGRLCLLLLWAAAPTRAAENAKRYLVGFRDSISQEEKAAALRTLEGRPLLRLGGEQSGPEPFEAWVVEAPDAALAAARLGLVVEEDARSRWIESAPPSFQGAPLPGLESILSDLQRLRPAAAPARRTPEEAQWGVARVDAPAAWRRGIEGLGVRVAVVDTGIDASHPDLAGRVAGGYNALDGGKAGNFRDDNGHGTHVAGIIAARRDGAGVVGVAPEASLYSVKVLDAEGYGRLSDIIQGLLWCARNGMQVANMSLGVPAGSELLRRAVRYAESRSVVLVAAAGNSGAGPASYPAAYPEVVSVSASTPSDALARFSSSGKVDFIAPGQNVVSTYLFGDYANLSGTSMAAPHVSGLAALSVSLGARGLRGPDGVYAALSAAASPLEGIPARGQGLGLVDAGRLERPR